MASSSLKPITLRLPEADLVRAREEAEALGVSVGVYLRMLVRQSLRHAPDPLATRRADALRHFSDAVSEEAEARGYTEDDIVTMTKRARTSRE